MLTVKLQQPCWKFLWFALLEKCEWQHLVGKSSIMCFVYVEWFWSYPFYRSSTCSHLQCFDASLYLQMNERKPTWNCPVCDKPAIYDNLVIDGYADTLTVLINTFCYVFIIFKVISKKYLHPTSYQAKTMRFNYTTMDHGVPTLKITIHVV